VPPQERRGLVIIDPPFEAADEFARLADRVAQAWRKWPTGVYAIWYPIKDRTGPDLLAEELAGAGIPKILRGEIELPAEGEIGALSRCGLLVVNPPWRLEQELTRMLPTLTGVLAGGRSGRVRLDWVAGER
jgi:23S rRNA (adenine2030-N6)-methyltransferase